MKVLLQNNIMFRALLLLELMVFFSGCDVIYKWVDKEGAEEKKLIGDNLPYEKNPTVEEIQGLLKIYGYNPGTVDGVFGARTRNAIARFQASAGMKVTKFADNETWKKLSFFEEQGFIVNKQLDIGKIQLILQNAGYQVGKIDGKYGPKTRQAVMTFQKDNDLKVDGKIGYHTLNNLYQISQKGLSGE